MSHRTFALMIYGTSGDLSAIECIADTVDYEDDDDTDRRTRLVVCRLDGEEGGPI